MTDRLQRYLDGELEEHDLTVAERSAAREFRVALSLAKDAFPPEPAPDLAPGVLAEIGRAPNPGRHRHTTTPGWIRRVLLALWSPRAVTVRPALAVGAVAVLFVAFAWVSGSSRSAPPAPGAPVQNGGTAVVAGATPGHGSLVRFRLDAPAAASVSLAGGFTGWQPSIPMVEESPGVWTVVVPLDPGVHDYAFVVDGREWVADPLAQRVDDGFGGHNSRIAVLVGAGQS